MDKLKMSTPDLTDKNIEQIAAIFPNVITETRDENGSLKKAVDFDLLKQALSKNLVEDDSERYRLDWPGKKASLLKANTPITKTLRPCREESVNFDTTENLYIEGDNFEVLKILQESYLGKVKMIYIDPPYNTGNDFIYKDNFAKSKDEYEEELGTTDEEGGKLFRNTDSNGRYHSDWLSMMYERLIVARDLLRDDGVIFISIDDNEVHNLRKICDEVFGEQNFMANIVWQKKYAATNDAKGFSNLHDHIIVYQKSQSFERILLPRTEDQNKPYKNNDGDGRGLWRSDNLLVKSFSDAGVFPIANPNTGEEFFPPKGSCWRASKTTMALWLKEKRIFFGKDGRGAPQLKRFLNEVQQGRVPNTWWTFQEVGHNDAANKELKALFNSKAPFDTPKPVSLIKQMLMISSNKNDIILDFFCGSATTAHAVMQLNAEDGGKRKFIMVQLPEKTDENSEAFKAGYKTISDIGKERIRRAGKKIVEEFNTKNQQLKLGEVPVDASKLDIGFRVYKTDSTNMKDVFYHPAELKQTQLSLLESNIKEDRTPEDLLTQVILDLGLELSLPIETKKIFGNTVFIVQTNALVACFDNNIDFKIVDTIADLKPFKVVFKDAGFKDDKDRINVEERFKRFSPETKVTVI
ncbi:SAM-dependent methyltransferase [Desulfonema limicola]|uniref:site-specific DNA-methyltransferase (adenine-specific) n=1 Tax=Desulfonema limicola TaxID=45656 RepID=A0A975B723_9BACT|nr:site-specific DNA-methyltransferase [Desulfonema limicola]QTA79877.1 SAM-dependent methyltransferase [Desulfonema limicola]